MGKTSNGPSTNVLISIYNRYAEAILDGEKGIEFRKPQFPDHVTRVYLYSTMPVKKIVGYFDVATVIRQSPRSLWNQFGKQGVIEHKDYMQYYANNEEACGIVVKSAVRFSRPVLLNELDKEMTVPQSFCYLDGDKIERLEKLSLGTNRVNDNSLFFNAFRRARSFIFQPVSANEV